MYITKEQQDRLNYERSIWEKINEEKDIFKLKQEFYHFKLEVLDKLNLGQILCSCGKKAVTYGLSLFMCKECNNELSESIESAHEDYDPNDESMSWNYHL